MTKGKCWKNIPQKAAPVPETRGLVVLLFAAVAMLSACRPSGVVDPVAGFEPVLDPGGSSIALVDGSVVITWDPVVGAEYYDVARAGSRLGRFAALGTVGEAAFTDNAPNPNRFENHYRVTARGGGEVLSVRIISFELQLFGPNVRFYDARYDGMADIEREINRIHDEEMFGSVIGRDGRRGQFSSQRFALFFKPGVYSFDTLRVGFYTHLAGLGRVPTETRLYATIETPPHLPNNNATCTFWRSIENLEIDGGVFRWAVSQAAPARRMKVNVAAEFDWNSGWASGGFSGDSYFGYTAGSWSQQQWYARNSHFAHGFHGVNWNKVMQGCTGEREYSNWDIGGSTTWLDATPVIREKPFLYFADGEFRVFVPALRRDAVGVSWTATDMGPGVSLLLETDFHVAREGVDTADTINAALEKGLHIFFTPGRYYLSAPIHVRNPGTVVLGTGLATLIPGPKNRYGALFVDDVENVTIAALMFDALYSSTYLVSIGGSDAAGDHSSAPTLLADLFLRVGGYREENVHVDVAALIKSNDVIGDHFWIWRADHGQGVGWDRNTSGNGLIVTGDRVTIYGLFVEHFHEYQTLWLGEDGRMFFYQSETPYDPFHQSVFSSHGGTVDGWAAYKVGNNVQNHLAVGLGIYAVFVRTGRDRARSESMFLENAIEVPHRPGVMVMHANIVEISGSDTETVRTGIRSIVNGTGAGVGGGFGRETLLTFSDGIATTRYGTETGVPPGDEVFHVPVDLLPGKPGLP